MKIKNIRIIIILLLGLSLLLTGCTKEVIDPFNENEVETIEIITGNSSVINKITDKLLIDSITNDLSNIKFKKLSVDDENKVLNNGNKLKLDSTFNI